MLNRTGALAERIGLTHGTGVRILFVGVILLLVGFSWDALQHYLDEQLASRETILTIANPSHLLIIMGAALIGLGLMLELTVRAAASPVHRIGNALAAGTLTMVGVASGVIAIITFDGAGHSHGGVSIFQATEVDLAASSLALTARLDGLAAAINQLEKLAERSEVVRANGHPLAHTLGQYAATMAGNDPSVFSQCTEIFSSGCYHGVVEAYFQTQKKLTPTVVTAFCSDLIGASLVLLRECAHGVGHGLTGLLAHNIFAALPFCEAFADNELWRECTDGVFMENVVHSVNTMTGMSTPGLASEHVHSPGHKAYFKRSDPLYPCDAVAADLQPSCFHYQNVLLTAYFGSDVSSVFAACDLAPPDAIGECYRGYGKNLSATGRLDWATDQCQVGRTEFAGSCVAGVVEQVSDVSLDVTPAVAYCGTVPASLAAACFDEVERLSLVFAGS